MTKNVYKNAQGKEIDMGRLLLQNENVRAVGNMKVNAKGDLLDHTNKVISSKPSQVKKQYDREISKDNKKT